jgi:hypothetical protein
MADGGRFADLAGQAAVRQAVEAAPRVERAIAAVLIVGGAFLLARYPPVRRAAWQVARRALVVGVPWLLRREFKEAWRAASVAAPAPAPPGASTSQAPAP